MVKITLSKSLQHHRVLSHEIRGLALHEPEGDVPGYEIRFELVATQPELGEHWSEWYFIQEDELMGFVRELHRYMTEEGHLSPQRQTGGSVQ